MQNTPLLESSRTVIGGLQQEDGGITATPRDDVYPYVYPRDAVFMTKALNAFGEFERSKRFYGYLSRVRRPRGEFYQRYNGGMPYVTNAHELDATPIVIQGIYDTYRRSRDRPFLESMWELVRECASFTSSSLIVDAGLLYTTNSIHENRHLEEGFEIWANSAAVRGLLDASRIAGELGQRDLEDRWLTSSKRLLASMVGKLYDDESGVFIKVLRDSGEKVRAPDVSQLAPFYFGIYHDDAVLARTLDRLEGALWNKTIGGFNRFRDFEIVSDWHWYTGGAGASWPLFTLWAAGFYRDLGIKEGVDACLAFLDSTVTEDLLIPEKVAPLERYREWNANELEFGDRILNGVRKIEGDAHKVKAPGCVSWACPLGWAHAEYVLFEVGERPREYELLQEAVPSVARRMRADSPGRS